MNLGIRYDVQLGAFNEDLDHQLSLIAEKLGPQFAQYPFPVPFIDTSIRGDHNNFGPRIGLAWDPTGTGRTNLHGVYGVAFDNMCTAS